jgi:hypothetical protein
MFEIKCYSEIGSEIDALGHSDTNSKKAQLVRLIIYPRTRFMLCGRQDSRT